MRRLIVIITFLMAFVVSNAQSNKDIANVYIKRAKEAIENSVDFSVALINFKKAMRYTDTITDRKVASLGASVYFEVYHKQPTLAEQLEFLEKAKYYSSQYFNLAKNTKSDEYIVNTENFVFIQENIEKVKTELEEIRKERLRKEKELRRLDSLKAVWENKSNSLSLTVDSIYKFNKNSTALYKKDGFYGVINDLGEVLIEANEYKDALSFDGYIIFKNQKNNPTKIYSFNTANKIGFKIPDVSDFNILSTHYGMVMLPRGNGRLVMYPNNSHKVFIYDLNVRKTIIVANPENLYKRLKKSDIIDKYNKDNELKINKEWYMFGGHLGGGVHPLYAIEGYELKGFLCSLDGRFLKSQLDYQYLGAFYNNNYQAVKGDKVVWVNQNGTEVNPAKDESGKYTGNSVIKKLNNGNYQILKEGIIILGKEKLERMPDFLRKFGRLE